MGCHIYAPGVSIGRSGVSTERRVRILRVDKNPRNLQLDALNGPPNLTRWWFQRLCFFSPLPGDTILTNIFQMGWNHQLAEYLIGPIRIFDGQK